MCLLELVSCPLTVFSSLAEDLPTIMWIGYEPPSSLGLFLQTSTLSLTETRVGAGVLWRIELMRGESACPSLHSPSSVIALVWRQITGHKSGIKATILGLPSLPSLNINTF